MSRPRIRTFKPEMFADEEFGSLTIPAQHLFFVLMSMADDEGRLRAQPAMIVGHGYPWRTDVTPRKLEACLAEIAATGMILRYLASGRPYVAFRHWRRHQQINKPRPSLLPSPPDPVVVRDNGVTASGSTTGTLQDDSRPHAQARPPWDRIGSRNGKEPPLTPPPAGGTKGRRGERWKEDFVSWATAVGVSGPESVVLKVADRVQPWSMQEPAYGFREFCREHWAESLTVSEKPPKSPDQKDANG